LVEQFAAQELSRAQICRGFGVSRKTGYKWYEQYLLEGVGGLADRSRRPHRQPQAVDEQTIGAILKARSQRPSWGERKLHAWLERERPERGWPCPSTIGAVLKRYGLTRPNKRRRRATPSSELTRPEAANQVWAIDFKGWFRTQDGVRCDPLTISDAHTRYLLRCQALDRTGGKFVRPLMGRPSASTVCRSASAPITARRSPRPASAACRSSACGGCGWALCPNALSRDIRNKTDATSACIAP
jgi:transposase